MSSDKKASRRELIKKILYWVIMASFIFSLIYVPLRAHFDEEYRDNSEYRLMIFQTVLAIFAINLPSFLKKKFLWKIPDYYIVIFTVFLWASIFCGEVMSFYYRFSFWDDILHLLSSMMLGILGFSLIEILNKEKDLELINLSPFFVAVFSMSFAVCIGVMWEFYEYFADGLLGLNMQKFAYESSTAGEHLVPHVGRAALGDTMRDLMLDCLGAFIASLFGYISLKKGKGWLDPFMVELFDNDEEKSDRDPTPCEEDPPSEYSEAVISEEEFPPEYDGSEPREEVAEKIEENVNS